MTTTDESVPVRLRWARLRFSIVAPLLASPPGEGELAQRLDELATQRWKHPTTGAMVRFGRSTIERWFYLAKSEQDPVSALARRVHKSAGTHPSLTEPLRRAIELQYAQHPSWSYQLHYDNFLALAELDPALGKPPSYTTVRRYMKGLGLIKQRRRTRGKHATVAGGATFERREVRSFEVEHVQRLWHLDFHVGSRKVLLAEGRWATAYLFGTLDDRSRLACHLQWYLAESAQTLVHGLCQAFLKRGLPRELLTDNGSAMTSAEVTEGLVALGIQHWTTLEYTPEQNAKQEAFWAQVEGRLMAMLEGENELTLELLNEATQAWIELEYQRQTHSETGEAPLDRFLKGPSVGRPCPSADELREKFRRRVLRHQRRSDGTISVEGRRFELPSRYRTLGRPTIRYASWDLSSVSLVDPRTDRVLATLLPIDKATNADRRRRVMEPAVDASSPTSSSSEPRAAIAPLLKKLMAEYSATGLPPAYLPLEHRRRDQGDATATQPKEDSP